MIKIIIPSILGFLALSAGLLCGEDPPLNRQAEIRHYVSEWGTLFYAQGGIVIDGTAYFTASGYDRRGPDVTPLREKSAKFPFVIAFDVNTFRKVRTYPFEDTYDSTPLVVKNAKGRWLVIAHEYKMERTVARDRDTAEVVWISPAKQPGRYFFGYSWYKLHDGSTLILAPSKNGLHAISSEDGAVIWHVERSSKGGVTPCVDQKNALVYYQCDGEFLKISALDGNLLQSVKVPPPNATVSWNTVLVNDSHGYFLATYWFDHKKREWNAGLRVYDQDLNLVWEKTGLPLCKKNTLTYVDGKLITGCGNWWSDNYPGKEAHAGAEWKYIPAYSIKTGELLWKCDLSEYELHAVNNAPYFNGFLYAECASPDREDASSKIFKINAHTGKLVEVFEYQCPVNSCAQCIISGGRLYSGSLRQDRTAIIELAKGSAYEWQSAFGDPQTNTYAVPDEIGVESVPMRELGPDCTRGKSFTTVSPASSAPSPSNKK